MNLFGKYKGLEKEKLVSYGYSKSGDMRGGSYSETVEEYNEESAIVTIVQRTQHNHEDTVKEYLVDKEILNELKAVFVKHRMKNWNEKKYARDFVADGASYTYDFDFETNSVSISSQHYPEEYSSKLRELNEIVAKYLENATLLPGLVLHEVVIGAGEDNPFKPKNGKIILSVISYRNDHLNFRIANGTEENQVMESIICLYRDGESTPIYEETARYKITFYAHSLETDSIELNERLTPGKYRLEAFGFVTEFEIR